MIATYLRSSSLNTFNSCEQKFFLEYVLGFQNEPNFKTIKGSCFHKVMELIGKYKLATQKNRKTFHDDSLGTIYVSKFDVDKLAKKSFDFYAKTYPQFKWDDKDLAELYTWISKVLKLQNGNFDPRNMQILDCERFFDVEIKEEWAKYDYKIHGENLSGYLALKGTIDLIITDETGIIELMDWKTGRRWDWAKNEEKTYEKLQYDPQLLFYYYVATKLFPGKPICCTIVYVNDGGPYTINFDESDYIIAEEMVREAFTKIKSIKYPNTIWPNSFCNFCTFSKHYFDDPKMGKNGKPKPICGHIKDELYQLSQAGVIEKYTNTTKHMKEYGEGGGKLDKK